MVQKRAMRAIFPEMGYVDILNHIGVCTLKERRDYLCMRYFTNIQSNTHKVNQLLPEKKDISTMISEHAIRTYPLPVTRTNRFRNSFIPRGLYHWQSSLL